jgi:transcription elongation factor Elf1
MLFNPSHSTPNHNQVQTKKRPTLAKRFKCPFCANENVVECKMDFKLRIGSLNCRLCGASYQMPIHHLHEPVDVFSEWLDDCEAAALGKPTGQAAAQESRPEYDVSDEDDEIDDPPPFEAKVKKEQPKASSASTNYADLGLDDSDDDSD